MLNIFAADSMGLTLLVFTQLFSKSTQKNSRRRLHCQHYCHLVLIEMIQLRDLRDLCSMQSSLPRLLQKSRRCKNRLCVFHFNKTLIIQL